MEKKQQALNFTLLSHSINDIVRESNYTIKSGYAITSIQLNIIVYLLSVLSDSDPPGKIYRLSVKEFERMAGTSYRSDVLEACAEALMAFHYDIRTDTSKDFKKVSLFNEIKYIHQRRELHIRVHEQAREYLFNLNRNFTRYSLLDFFKLNSFYSQRLYQVFCMDRFKGVSEVSIQALRETLGLYNPRKKIDKYPRYGAFKTHVIAPAVAEINEKTHLEVSFEEKKSGRSVEKLIFYIGDSDASVLGEIKGRQQIAQPIRQDEIDDDTGELKVLKGLQEITFNGEQVWLHPEEKSTPKLLKSIKHLGRKPVYFRMKKVLHMDHYDCLDILSNWDMKDITRALYQTELDMKSGSVKNPAGLFEYKLDKE